MKETFEEAQKLINLIGENLVTMTPHQVSDQTVRLSILYGSLGDELATAEAALAKEWLRLRPTCGTNSEAEKRTKGTEAFAEKKKLEYAVRGIKEIIQALKKRQQVLTDEANMRY